MRAILLNPGPVTISEGVRRAMISDDLSHHEPEYADLQDDLVKGLLAVYRCQRDDWRAVLLAGSGTTALEAMLSSLVPADGRLLVIENGVHGERLHRIAAIHEIECEAETVSWINPWPMGVIADRLRGGHFTHVAAVYHEPTTGRLNPAIELADLCERHGVKLMLDTISSYGAETMPCQHPAMIAVTGSTGQCLHGVPGAAFVVVRKSALQEAAHPRTLSLNLKLWSRHQLQSRTPFTPPIPCLMAFRQALAELDEQGGWSARRARYRVLGERIRRALAKFGVEPMLREDECSAVMRAYAVPPGLRFEDIHAGLKQRGFIIGDGEGDLSGRIMRIAVMGDLSDYDISRLEFAFQSVFDRAEPALA